MDWEWGGKREAGQVEGGRGGLSGRLERFLAGWGRKNTKERAMDTKAGKLLGILLEVS